MTRSSCFGLCVCLALSLTVLACGSSNSNPGTSAPWDQARIGDAGTNWWVNARKGAYFISAQFSPSYVDSATGRALVITFTQSVLAKLKAGAAPATLVPAASELPGGGWQLDPQEPKTASGPGVATTEDEAVALIDGSASPFYCTDLTSQKDCSKLYQATGLAWEIYAKDPSYLIELKVWQMASAADATALYSDLLKNSLYSNVTWVDCTGSDPANLCPQ